MSRKSEPLSYYLQKGKCFDLKSYRDFQTTQGVFPSYDYGEQIVRSLVPLVPFKTFLIDTPQDFVMALKLDLWSMFELIKIPLGDEMISIVLISRRDGKQFVGAADDDNSPSVKEFAQYLGYEYFRSHLKVSNTCVEFFTPDKCKQIINVSLDQIWDLLNSKNSSMYPQKRNSHSMNHNQKNMTYIVDVYKSLPVTKFLNIKNVKTNFKFKTILGLPIRLPISQSVIAFARGIEDIASWSEGMDLLIETDSDIVFEKQHKTTKGALISRIEYHYNKYLNKRHLYKIVSYSPRLNCALSKIEFHPSLADCRFELKTISTSALGIFINGLSGVQVNDRPYLVGTVSINTEKDKFEKLMNIVKIKPGVKTMNNNYKPSWWIDRDVITTIDSKKIQFKAGINRT